MRIGIMGGTLDPVHNGHIQMAQAALERLKLDRVMLLPAGDPPHKAQPSLKSDRMEMARLAAQNIDGLFACGIEVLRDGTTYTVDTLLELHEKNPNSQWFYIIGADTLDVLDTWRNFQQVAKLCAFAVFGRADESACKARIHQLEDRYGAQIIDMHMNIPNISSTEIRARIASGQSAQELLPKAVDAYIRENGLYLCSYSQNEIKAMLQADLKPTRYAHTLGVAETALHLAKKCGVEPRRAELAALLHDCAKELSIDQMCALAQRRISDLDALEMESANLLHAPAGAALAAQKYGVRDPEILSAIRKHTLGGDSMNAMDALIYTADFIEPGRADFTGLAQARALAETDIFAAMRKCAQLTNAYVESQGKRPHPRSLAMLDKNQS